MKPYYKNHWLENLETYIQEYDFWHDGVIEELEEKTRDVINRKYSLAVNSSSNAIFMCLYVWSKKYPNRNEVIIPNWGYPAVFKACKVLGLEPIPVDIEKHTLGMIEQGIFDVISPRTLAVVHIENNGIIGDPQTIRDILTDDILFIEDSAPSMLQDKAGTFGDVAMFSFSPTKPLMAGEGSIILTDNKKLYEKLKILRHTSNYENRDASLNFMLSPFLAAYLLPQFKHLDYLGAMRSLVHINYKKYLDIFEEPYIATNRHGAIMYLSQRADKVSKKLSQNGIEHRYKYYPCYDDSWDDYPVSHLVREQIIDLPMHHEIKENQIKLICDIIKRVENA